MKQWRLLVIPLLFSCSASVELLPGDDAGSAGLGASCAASCGGGLACLTSVGAIAFPGGFCTRACTGPKDCPSPGDVCGVVNQMSLCLPSCNLSADSGCRDGGYACCMAKVQTLGPGACAPISSDYCGG